MGNSANNFRVGPHSSGGQLIGYGWTNHLGSMHEDHDADQAVFAAAVSAAKQGFQAFHALLSSPNHPWRSAYLALSQALRAELCATFAAYS